SAERTSCMPFGGIVELNVRNDSGLSLTSQFPITIAKTGDGRNFLTARELVCRLLPSLPLPGYIPTRNTVPLSSEARDRSNERCPAARSGQAHGSRRICLSPQEPESRRNRPPPPGRKIRPHSQ